jgi:hypothetical protein
MYKIGMSWYSKKLISIADCSRADTYQQSAHGSAKPMIISLV